MLPGCNSEQSISVSIKNVACINAPESVTLSGSLHGLDQISEEIHQELSGGEKRNKS